MMSWLGTRRKYQILPNPVSRVCRKWKNASRLVRYMYDNLIYDMMRSPMRAQCRRMPPNFKPVQLIRPTPKSVPLEPTEEKDPHFTCHHFCLVPSPSCCRSTKPSSTNLLWLLGPPDFRLHPRVPFEVLTFSFCDPYKSFPCQNVPARACPRQGSRQGLTLPLSSLHLMYFFVQVVWKGLFEG